MNLLGAKLYDPSSAASKVTTSLLAMTAIDTTNLRIAFTVPAHGFVHVKLSCVHTGSTTIAQVLLGILEGSTVRARVSPNVNLLQTAVATSQTYLCAHFTVAGLSAGAVNWDAAYGVEIVSSAGGAIKYGGPNNTTTNDAWGAFVFEIWDPQPLPTAAPAAVGGLLTGPTTANTGLADVRQLLGTAWLAPGTAGTPDVNVKLWNALTTVALPLIPTTAGRTLDVSATGEAGVDWANVGSPTTTLGLSGTTIKTATDVATATTAIQADTDDIQTRLPAALTANGNMKSSMVEILTTALTETAGLLAGGFKKFFNVASPTGTLNSIPDAVPDAAGGLPVTGNRLTAIPTVAAVTTVTNLTNAPTAGDLTATMKTSVTTAATAATPAVTVSDKTGFKLASDGLAAVVAWTVAITGNITGALSGSVGSVTAGVTLAASAVQAIWDALTSALSTAGSIGKLLVDNINATISSRSSHSASDVWAVATRLLTAGTNIALAKGVGVTGFNDLDAAGVRSAVGLASANLDTQLGAIDDYIDTEVAAIKAKTDNLPSDPADASDIAAAFSTVNGTLSTIAGYIDTEVAAIKAKTDNLPASPAAVGSAMTLTAAYDAAKTAAQPGDAMSLISSAKGISRGEMLRILEESSKPRRR